MSTELPSDDRQDDTYAGLADLLPGRLLLALELLRAAEAEVLRGDHLSTQQYTVLRILLHDAPAGLSCTEIAKRMTTSDSDLSRMLDRLEKRGLVDRERQRTDRRMVLNRLTDIGRARMVELEGLVV